MIQGLGNRGRVGQRQTGRRPQGHALVGDELLGVGAAVDQSHDGIPGGETRHPGADRGDPARVLEPQDLDVWSPAQGTGPCAAADRPG